MNENLAKQKVRRFLEEPQCNALVYSFAGSMFSHAGMPDWFVAHRIWTGWIEWKYSHGVLSTVQKRNNEKLRARGVNACVIRYIQAASYASVQLEGLDGYKIAHATLDDFVTGNDFLLWLKENVK